MNPRSFGNFVPMSGPAHHNEFDLSDNVPPALPGANLGESVRADNEEQLIVGSQLRLDLLDRVDRKAKSCARLEARRFHSRLALYSELDHAIAVFVWRVRLLMRRTRRGNQQHPVQFELACGFSRDAEV